MDIPNTNSALEPVKFTSDELAELNTIRQVYEQITVSLGQLEIQKRELRKGEARLNDRLTATENQEKVFLDKIVAKSGEGSFDMATGIFTPKKA